jgi:hypothetical protein
MQITATEIKPQAKAVLNPSLVTDFVKENY